MEPQNQVSGEQISPRQKILSEALGIVMKDRNSVYGNPEDNFLDIANLWTAYMRDRTINDKTPFTSMDVVVMNMLIKVARLKKTPDYHDGLVDIAGYAACGGDIQRSLRISNDPRKEPSRPDFRDNFNRPFEGLKHG